MSLLNVERVKLVQIDTIKKPTKKSLARGCEYCPTNSVKGVNKIFNKVRGRKIMVFVTAPGPKENEEKQTLSGAAGDFFFDELEKVGISHKDCDIQNSVRCYPADNRDGKLYKREAKKEEIHCCSIYNEEAINKSEAKIYILLGAATHKSVLGKEYQSSKKVFWSERLQAKVYCLAHPNYFLGGYATQIALDEFRDALKSVNADLDGSSISQYSYIEKQKYVAIKTTADAISMKHKIIAAAKKGIRTAVDIESDSIKGKPLYLCCGFSTKPGEADVVILDHPKARKINGKWRPLNKNVRRRLHKIVRSINEDPEIKKVFHQGSSDTRFMRAYNGTRVRGYDYDTMYAEFLAYPDRRAYGLAAIALQRYPQFGNYKTIIVPDCIPKTTNFNEHNKLNLGDLDKAYTYIGANDLMHFSNLPLKKLVLRNGADCDITKRIELSTKKKINHSLLTIYMDAAFTLADMEPNGPEFDYKHCAKLKLLYPPRFDVVKEKLQMLSGQENFNPGSPIQVRKYLYDTLKIKPPEAAFDKKKKKKYDKDGKAIPQLPGTGKLVLEILGRDHEGVRLLQEYRKLGKIISTYINAFYSNAKQNYGRLKTKWWLTGTRTGRLSSGGDKQVKETKNQNINLQNIHGDTNLKNLATADRSWRKVYSAINRAIHTVANAQILNVEALVKKAHSTANKDKQKTYNEELKAALARLAMRLHNSNKFKRLCKAIVKKYGEISVLLGYDQGQIEVRVMAQASGDENLIRDCKSGDIHSKVGHEMTGWAIDLIKKDKKTRTLTKNIHFGILFGLGANGLMAFILNKDPNSTIDETEAARLYANYFKAYPRIADFIVRMRKFVEEHGFVENMFGFRRPLVSGSLVEGYDQDEDGEEQAGGAYWGNQAINTPIQGAAHQLMLIAVAMLKSKKQTYKILGVPTLEVHDYIGWKTKLKNLVKAYNMGKQLLEKEPLKYVKKKFKNIKWKIPLVVEGQVGFRLGDSVECEDDGKLKPLHVLLADMFIETWQKEIKLELDLGESCMTKKVGIIGTNSAGKTTMCYDILARLKKAGAICDGVLQQDRRLTFQVKRDSVNLLDVEPLAQYSLLLQQMKTEADIILGEGVDIVVSDRSPFDLYAYYVNVLGGDKELGRFIYHWCATTFEKLYLLRPVAYEKTAARLPSEQFRDSVNLTLLKMAEQYQEYFTNMEVEPIDLEEAKIWRKNIPNEILHMVGKKEPHRILSETIIASLPNILTCHVLVGGSYGYGMPTKWSDLDITVNESSNTNDWIKKNV